MPRFTISVMVFYDSCIPKKRLRDLWETLALGCIMKIEMQKGNEENSNYNKGTEHYIGHQPIATAFIVT